MLSGLILTAALMAPTDGRVRAASLPDVPIPDAHAAPATPPAGAPAAPGQLPPIPAVPQPPQAHGEVVPTACEACGEVLADRHFGPPYSVWAEGDYRIYWLKPGPLPVPLLATTTAAGTQRVLVGGQSIDFGPADAFGFSAGTWLNSRHTVGVSVGGFLTEQLSSFAAVNSTAGGSPDLFRPFTNAFLAQAAQVAVATPGLLAGEFWAEADSRLAGADVTFHRNLLYCADRSVTLLAGGRFLDLDEALTINQVSRPLGGGDLTLQGVPVPNTGGLAVAISDRFRTRNQFWGGTLGVRAEQFVGPVFANLTAKVGMGTNQQDVEISGNTRVTAPGVPVVPGGLLALPGANVGRFSNARFAILTELGAQTGVQVSQSLRLLVGYDFLYLNDVARPGPQIDPVINPRFIPTSPAFGTLSGIRSPIPTGARNEFFVHGVRFGVELRY